ncbi:hypothetical protein Peur_015042 [Populus x canadensis]|uniref:inactive protein RESTRICTED TEV MOVEMENT 2-like n=1 Tax=Populus nigra TaxID=3691 RepID=UPI002B27A220|nr:inactive protein RESTRICTED TEV MOVEMENT 2-like [Populus nigra]
MDSTRPLAKVNDQVYEDIDPKMEWVNDAGFDTLLVRLPGSTKQQLRIQAATGDRKLKITGKSRQGDNKLIRFNKELTVPSVYDLDQIRAKFEGGVLYIKHPKKISVQPCRYRKIMQAQLQRLKSLQMKNQKTKQVDKIRLLNKYLQKHRQKDKQVEILMDEQMLLQLRLT